MLRVFLAKGHLFLRFVRLLNRLIKASTDSPLLHALDVDCCGSLGLYRGGLLYFAGWFFVGLNVETCIRFCQCFQAFVGVAAQVILFV